MRKILAIEVGLFLFFFFPQLQSREILPTLRGAYYYPTDHRFRDIYSTYGLYSIETSVQAWKALYPWASAGFLYASGSSIGENDSTRFYMIPIGIGLKYFFKTNRVFPYLGLGAIVAYAHINNDSKFVKRKQARWGVGGIAKTGFLAYATQSLFFDFFLDYTYLKMSFSHDSSKPTTNRKGDLSGLSVGGGIGYKF